jgi:hypothetical protein
VNSILTPLARRALERSSRKTSPFHTDLNVSRFERPEGQLVLEVAVNLEAQRISTRIGSGLLERLRGRLAHGDLRHAEGP